MLLKSNKILEKITSHTIRGKRFRIVWKTPKGLLGRCDAPHTKGKTIEIDPKQTDQDLMDTVIHESIHAAFFDLDEDSVDNTARDIARLLTRMGYHRQTAPAGNAHTNAAGLSRSASPRRIKEKVRKAGKIRPPTREG